MFSPIIVVEISQFLYYHHEIENHPLPFILIPLLVRLLHWSCLRAGQLVPRQTNGAEVFRQVFSIRTRRNWTDLL